MKQILVTGATGTVGREVVAQLLPKGAKVKALTRNPELAALPPGVEVVRGDLTDVASLDACLEGVDTVFLVWTASPASAAAAVQRISQQARRIILLTSPHKTAHPFFQQPNPMRGVFEGIERLIEESSVEWTFIRPGMFAANGLSWWGPQVRGGEVVRWPYGAAPTAPIHEKDIAAVAVHTLIEDGHHGAEYVLTGPASLSQFQQVEIIGEVLGRPLFYDEMTPEEVRREWAAPAQVVNMLLDAWAAAMGQPAYLTSTVADLTGRPARTYREWVTDHIEAFHLRG
ncbi:NAD(P)H-binding protein [Geothrix sp. 21YS21S-4]|uniref:NAD(P)H-binding protein n=1 Tax=Geothrix sp. 21YS21S-4 TaxID=3068889 RepID=UPI0027B9D888|nr:NAD(P)H-binding protein [Geothrix sp. 21YS21S-4]